MDIEFDKLITLQKLDSEIRSISAFLANIPSLTEEIDKKIELSSQAVTKAKEKLTLNQKKRRELEAQVKDMKAQISKYKRQLNEVKTNKEYTSLLKEIEEAEKTVDTLEEEIISEMLFADEIETEIKVASQKHNQDKERLLKESETIFQKKKELEAKMKNLAQEKEEISPRIPSDQFALYLRIFNKKTGIALSPVTDDFCSMCHMRIRPQALNELKEGKKLILCENCGRILYWLKKPPDSKG